MAIVNLFAIALAAYFISIMSNQIIVRERDFQSEVLGASVNYATQYAIERALYRSDADQTVENLKSAQFDPTYAIDDFSRMMCMCYNMSISPENMKLVKANIDGGLFCVEDGYYKFMIADSPVIAEGEITDKANHTLNSNAYYKQTQNRTYITYDADNAEASHESQIEKSYNMEKDLVLSPKLPYIVPVGDGPNYYVSVNMTDSADRIYSPGQTIIKRNETDTDEGYIDMYYYQNSKPYVYQLVNRTNTYHDYNGAAIPSAEGHGLKQTDILTDARKLKVLNIRLEQELNNSIKQISAARGKVQTYNVYLPTATTSTGVNPIRNSTLIISMSKASFAGKYAYLSEPVLGGFKFVQRQRIAVFRDSNGTVRYAYAIQAKGEEIIDSWYSLASALQTEYTDGSGNIQKGVKPAFEYLNLPLRQDVY